MPDAPRATTRYAATTQPDLVCLSHLRWNFVFQRPQHLLTRCARDRRVFYVEEPVFDDGPARMDITEAQGGVRVVVPHLPRDLAASLHHVAQRQLLDAFLREHEVRDFALWFYTPMALEFARHLEPCAVVYDCMDELSAFAGAPLALRGLEAELLERADVVFTGGQSLYESKRSRHHNVHAFPSSVDVAHFRQARAWPQDPEEQRAIPHPRLGFFGVIDERMDLELLRAVAAARPAWHLVLLGPVVKIDPATLPRAANIHYLGGRKYDELPGYVAGWDVALLPFARNESTRFISPTKTPEYLAAGKPVVSTSIRDVVRPYGERGLVRIADEPADFVAAIEQCLAEDDAERLGAADAFLAPMSWDATWSGMQRLLDAAARPAVAPRRARASALPAERPSDV